MGETQTFGIFIPPGMQYPRTDVLRIKQRKNRLCGFGPGRAQIFGLQKKLKTA